MPDHSRWNVIIKTPMGDDPVVFDLQIADGKLSGSIIGEKETNDIFDGVAHGHELSWGSKISKPLPMKLKFTATVDGSSITGGAKSLFGSVPFSGTRA